MKKSNERIAFENGWLEGKYFQKDYGSLLENDKEAINEQIQEDWETYQDKVKKLTIPVVSNRREMLFAYEKMRTNHIIGATDEWRYKNVDLFLSK